MYEEYKSINIDEEESQILKVLLLNQINYITSINGFSNSYMMNKFNDLVKRVDVWGKE